jgi:hypothetical protein
LGEFLTKLAAERGEGGQAPPDKIAEVDPAVEDAVRGVLASGDRLLLSPTFRLLMTQAQDSGRREERARLAAEVEAAQARVRLLEFEVEMHKLEAASLRNQEALVRKGLEIVANVQRMNQAAQVEIERERAAGATRVALIGAAAPAVLDILRGGRR